MATGTLEDRRLDEAPTDEALMFEYRNTGDMDVFRQLVERYERSLYSCLMSTGVIDEDLAETIFKDIWLRVHKMRESYEPYMDFCDWLKEITFARATYALALRSKERSTS